MHFDHKYYEQNLINMINEIAGLCRQSDCFVQYVRAACDIDFTRRQDGNRNSD